VTTSDVTEEEIDKILAGTEKRGRKKASSATRVVPPDADTDAIEPPLPVPAPSEAEQEKQITMEQLEALGTIVPDLPKPEENVKTLGSLIAKYSIGQRPDFKLQVYRTWPKIFSGNRKADGFLDDYSEAIDEAFIQNEYGGGDYTVKVVGPHSNSNLGTRHYESVRVSIQGLPKEHRVSRLQQTTDAREQSQGPQVAPPRHEDNPKIVEIVMGTLKDAISSERDERRRVEARAEVGLAEARAFADPLVNAEQRRHDDVIRLERERADSEKRAMEDRAAVERERADERQRALEAALAEQRRLTEEVQRKMVDMENARRDEENNRPSIGSQFREIMQAFPKPEPVVQQVPQRGELELAGKVVDQSSERHRAEIEAMRSNHAAVIDSLRSGHEREIAATRDANAREIAAEREAQRHREQRHDEQLKMERGVHEREVAGAREAAMRELAAERESWRHRELRYEDQIKQEREERRRDQDHARSAQEERDRAAKDRLDTTEINLKTQWEARLAMVETNNSERIRWLQSEIDKKVTEVSEVRGKLQDTHDPVVQMSRFREFREAARDGLGLVETQSGGSSSSSSSSAGIGLSGPGGVDLNEMMQTVAEKGPELLTALSTLVRGPGQPPPGMAGGFIPGQVVQTPLGPMMVVQTPQGNQLAPMPPPPRLLPQGEPQQQPAPPPPPGGEARQQAQQTAQQQYGQQRPVRRKRGGSADFDPIPNLAEGLERPKAPWEQRQGPFSPKPAPQAARAPQPAQPPQQQQVPAAVATQPHRPEKVPMNAIEKQIAQAVAKMVHDSVNGGDEPEEFVEKVMSSQVPTAILEGLCAKSDQEIIAGIQAVEPRSAGATPAGHAFVRQAMGLLRQAVANDDDGE
jgi:hypothetical protein